ncbi:hypothetical protein JTE90_005184 [Oedothorax gibbosus]|uniref:Uncharacterized protein n=1 Tax=Oedothorax gibbosus TaxID=931172 RepID=A0AAV6UJN0_9ARAC|nr:hypothetical protein JTE90_005184 [Oedothorax gibbosus]
MKKKNSYHHICPLLVVDIDFGGDSSSRQEQPSSTRVLFYFRIAGLSFGWMEEVLSSPGQCARRGDGCTTLSSSVNPDIACSRLPGSGRQVLVKRGERNINTTEIQI